MEGHRLGHGPDFLAGDAAVLGLGNEDGVGEQGRLHGDVGGVDAGAVVQLAPQVGRPMDLVVVLKGHSGVYLGLFAAVFLAVDDL